MIELDFSLARGEFALQLALRSEARALALFGDSGCGKTSTLYAIAGLLRPTRGRIVLDDRVLFDSQAGVDVSVIRDYLGHASVATTSRYITTNLQMKREVLDAFWKRAGLVPSGTRKWHPSPKLLAFLLFALPH